MIKIYLVNAYRWGDNVVLKENDNQENNLKIKHSIPVGVFDDQSFAIEEAKLYKSYRGGKYECVVFSVTLNEQINQKNIVFSTFEDYKNYI